MKNKKEIIALLVVQSKSTFVAETKEGLESNGFLVYVYETAESLFLSMVSKEPKIVFISSELQSQIIKNVSSRLKIQYKIKVVSLNEQLEEVEESKKPLWGEVNPKSESKNPELSIQGSIDKILVSSSLNLDSKLGKDTVIVSSENKELPQKRKTSNIKEKTKLTIQKGHQNQFHSAPNFKKTDSREDINLNETDDITVEDGSDLLKKLIKENPETKVEEDNIESLSVNKTIPVDTKVIISKEKTIIDASSKVNRQDELSLSNLLKIFGLKETTKKNEDTEEQCFLCSVKINSQYGYLILQTNNQEQVNKYLESCDSDLIVNSCILTKINNFTKLDEIFIGISKKPLDINIYFISMGSEDTSFIELKDNSISPSYFSSKDILDFPLYLLLEHSNKKIEYISAGSSFMNFQLENLKNKNIKLYFEEMDRNKILLYLQMNKINLKTSS